MVAAVMAVVHMAVPPRTSVLVLVLVLGAAAVAVVVALAQLLQGAMMGQQICP